MVRATLDSDTTRNRLDDELLGELDSAIQRAESTPRARVLVLEATGQTFCSGLALGELDRADWRSRTAAFAELLRRLSASPLVTIAMVDGAAVGGGVGLAAACDQVIAGPGATFRMTEVLLGLVPAAILPFVASRVGMQRAFSMALTASELSDVDACTAGLADQRGAADELRRVVLRLRAADSAAVRALKRYRIGLRPEPPGQRELIAEVLEERFADPDTHRRLARFEQQRLMP